MRTSTLNPNVASIVDAALAAGARVSSRSPSTGAARDYAPLNWGYHHRDAALLAAVAHSRVYGTNQTAVQILYVRLVSDRGCVSHRPLTSFDVLPSNYTEHLYVKRGVETKRGTTWSYDRYTGDVPALAADDARLLPTPIAPPAPPAPAADAADGLLDPIATPIVDAAPAADTWDGILYVRRGKRSYVALAADAATDGIDLYKRTHGGKRGAYVRCDLNGAALS